MGRLLILLGSFWLASGQAATIDWPQFETATRQTLVDLIRLDTSQPQGNEYLATDYLKQRLDAVGIPATVYDAAPGRASIVARIKGNGSMWGRNISLLFFFKRPITKRSRQSL